MTRLLLLKNIVNQIIIYIMTILHVYNVYHRICSFIVLKIFFNVDHF